MLASFVPSADDYIRLLPEITMVVMGTLIMVLDSLLPENPENNLFGTLSLLTLFAALGEASWADRVPGAAFSNMIVVDGFATFFRVLVIGVGILTVLSSFQYLKREHATSGDYHALVLFSITG